MEAPTNSETISSEGDARFTLLLDLIREINEGASTERVFALVADALRRIFDIDRFAVTLVQEDGSLHITTSQGLSPGYLQFVQQHIDQGIGPRVMARRKPMWIPDASTSWEFGPMRDAAREEGFRSVLILPLFSGSDPLGYLIMYHDELRAYSLPEIALAQAFAQQAAFALQNARLLAATEARRIDLEERFQRRVAEAEAIDEIVLDIGSSLDLGDTLQAIADAAASLSGSSYSSIYLRDNSGSYRAMAAHGVPLHRLQQVVLAPSDGLMNRMRHTGQPAETTDFATEEIPTTEKARDEVTVTGARATLGVPLMHGRDVVGALYVARREAGSFPPDTVQLMRRLASFAQVALQNAQRFSDVEAERSRLQAYVDAIPEAVLVFDREGRVVLLNEILRKEWGVRTPMIGLSRDDVFHLSQVYSSRPLRFRFDPDAVFQRVLATGKPEQGLLELEDSSRVFEMHFSALRSEAGEIDGVVATVRDITLPLELGRERSRSHLLTQLLDLSILLNSNLTIAALTERVVEAAMELVGAQGGMIGLLEGESIIFRRVCRDTIWRDVHLVFRRGEGVPGQVWETTGPYVANNGATDSYVQLELQHELGFRRLVDVPLVDSAGKLVGVLEIHDPIVERDFGQMDVEALRLLAHQAAIAIENARLSQLKDEFLSIVSHELKTPVTSIKGFAQVLMRRLSPDSLERGARYLDVINRQADRLSALINDLLDLSRIQSGRFSFETSTLDYGQLVREVVAEMELMASSNPVQLRAPERITVKGSSDRLRQILTNLIDNAVKHGPQNGSILLSVEARDGEVVTYVQDEGRGLPPGEGERVFLPYYQVRESGRQQAKGLGLGLFITRRIVEGHGGRIWLDTTDRTTFCFTLPGG